MSRRHIGKSKGALSLLLAAVFLSGALAGAFPAETLADGHEYTDVIDLSFTHGKAGEGFVIAPNNTVYNMYDSRFLFEDISQLASLTFNMNANGEVYRLSQTGVPNPSVGSVKGPKYGTSTIGSIVVNNDVAVTLVASGIDILGSIYLTGTAKLTLLLDDSSYIRTSIHVPSTAEIIIDSLNGNDINDSLIMPSNANSTNDNAKIGGSGGAGSTAGTITINGGAIDITARSTGAGIGGGGQDSSGNGVAGTGGTITINGGSVSVTQYGSGNDLGTGHSGAGIGGGGGVDSANSGAGAGNLKITGGTVTVRQYTRAAGIGGGTFGPAGNITIEGGNIDIAVIRRIDQSGAGEGAGIGNAAGTNEGTGNITITGGTVKSVANYTGIGRVHSNSGSPSFRITISGGTVYAKGMNGPGIGFWGGSSGGLITFTGGTVIAESDKSTGIGCSLDNNTNLCLDAPANVRAYSGGTLPAINADDNTGNGYYVNASFSAALSGTADTTLKVLDGTEGTLLKTLTLPAAYRHFAYSSDLAAPRIDTVLAYGTTLLGTVLRVQDDSPQIYSVITRAGYNTHNSNANSGALPVKLNANAYYVITEKHTDIYGNPIADVSDSISLAGPGTVYSKTLPAIPGYIAAGYTWLRAPDGSGADYTPGNPSGIAVSANADIYLVYRAVSNTTLTVSKTVTGTMANKTARFGFTIGMFDYDGTALAGAAFAYEITDISGVTVVADVLTLSSNGEWTFRLKHGERLVINSVSSESYIRIVEEAAAYYEASFIDSEDVTAAQIFSGDTALLTMTGDPRAIAFINERIIVPETGITDLTRAPILSVLSLLGLTGLTAFSVRKRRRA